jgi:putative DNA primase/helicase
VVTPPAAPVLALSVAVGLGKTRAWRERVALALARTTHTGVLAVPRHRLGDEIVHDLAAAGITARVYRGREANDPDQPGEKMCREIERAMLITEALGAVTPRACKKKDKECGFYHVCGYQRQRQQRPDIWIVPHQLLFRERPSFISEPDSVVIDEAFWGAALHGVERPYRLLLSAINQHREIYIAGRGRQVRDSSATADLMAVSARVYRALEMEGGGRIRRAALAKAGVTGADLKEAYRLEWRRKIEVEVWPGMPFPQVRAICNKIMTHNQLVGRLARFWDLLQRTLIAPDERSPWLEPREAEPMPGGEGTAPVVLMVWRDDIHPSWTAPTVVMDATMPIEIVRQFFPAVDIPRCVAAPMPNSYVRQIIDRPMTAEMLIPSEYANQRTNATRRANVERVRKFLLVRADDVRPGTVLVITQLRLETELIAGGLPANVTVRHFNDIAGENAWKDVALVIVIGRTEPAPSAVERTARALFGAAVQEILVDHDGAIRYPRTTRGIRMRTGRGVAVEGPYHPDPRAEAVRRAICEAQLVQAIGRGRGVNRTDANALQIDILTNVVLPIEVDEVTTWDRIQPGTAHLMRTAGAVPLSYTDMATAYPDLFASREAAKKTIMREAGNWGQTPIEDSPDGRNRGQTPISYLSIGVCPQFSRQRYRRRGARGPAVVLLYDSTWIDPKDWLTERLGEVMLLASEDDEAEATGSGERAAPAARGFVEHRIREGSGRFAEPVCAEVIRYDFGLAAEAEISQFIPPRLRTLRIEIAPEFIITLRSGRSRWLASIDESMCEARGPAQEPRPDLPLPDEGLLATVRLPSLPSFYAIVDEVTGGAYPTEADWLEATRLWRVRSRCAV